MTDFSPGKSRRHSRMSSTSSKRTHRTPGARPSCLLTHLRDGTAVHALIGLGRKPWAVITVYTPDPARWNRDLTERR